MLHLCVHRSELTYEAALSSCFSAVIDAPGQIVAALIAQFDQFDVGLSDISLDDGPLEDKGIGCELYKADASILVLADRLEVHFFAIDKTIDAAEMVVRGVWEAATSVSANIVPKSHSLLFEMDCEIPAESYHAALDNFCRPHEGLPKSTETAVVYYLPKDASLGFLDSSFVLNRSAEIEGGILLAATLVFDGKQLDRDGIVEVGHDRLRDLLSRLEIAVQKESGANV